MIYLGYARVSTEAQNLDMQLAALMPLCGDRIFLEKKSGMSRSGRTELAALITEAKRLTQSGDNVTICVYSLSRLGRRMVETVGLIEELATAGINFQSITESLDTGTIMGRCILRIIASMAQAEAELVQERTRAGLRAAREKGVKLGRRANEDSDAVSKALELIDSGMSVHAAAQAAGMSDRTLKRRLRAA